MSMKLVEVIPGERTDPSVADDVAEVAKKIGRTPVRVLKDSPGFIVNRINAADTLFFCLVLDKGIATPPEVDGYARSQGLPMGPYELIDFVGVDVAWDSLSYFSQALSPEYGKGVTFGRMVQAKQLGKKTGRGFYDWSTGKAQMPAAQPTDKISIMDIFSLEINEAVKLIEEGVARPEDVEKGVTLGMNRPFGPISVAKDLSNAEVKAKLEELAAKFDCKVFAPTRAIAEGRLRDAIEGRLSPKPEGAVLVETAGPVKPVQETAKDAGPVRLERLAGGVARIVLNRPKFNTINGEVLEGLDRIITELWDDPEVRVVIVTGEGGVFSAGADLSQFFSSAVAFMEFARKGARVMTRLAELPKLTIAVLKGYALGGGPRTCPLLRPQARYRGRRDRVPRGDPRARARLVRKPEASAPDWPLTGLLDGAHKREVEGKAGVRDGPRDPAGPLGRPRRVRGPVRDRARLAPRPQ